MRRHLLPIVLAGLVLAAGCSTSDDDPQAESETTTTTSTASTSVSPTATATPADPFAIPEVIDAAYVDRVLAELYRIDGDVLRKVLASDSLNMSDLAPLRAIYNDPQYEPEAKNVLEAKLDPAIFQMPPGNRRVNVTQVHRSDPDCIVVEVEIDFSDVVIRPPAIQPTKTDFIALSPTQLGADEADHNPTPLSIVDAEVLPIGELPDRPCE